MNQAERITRIWARRWRRDWDVSDIKIVAREGESAIVSCTLTKPFPGGHAQDILTLKLSNLHE